MFILIGLIISSVAIFISLFIHELGHVLAGCRNGLQLSYMSAGPLKIVYEDQKYKISCSQTIDEWSGLNFMIASDASKLNTKNYQHYIIGGVIASLIMIIINIISIIVISIYFNKVLLLFFLISSLSNCAIFFVTYFPFKNKTGLYYTDGKRYKELKKESQIGKNDFFSWKLVQDNYNKDSLLTMEEKGNMIKSLVNSNDVLYRVFGYYQSFEYSCIGKKEALEKISLLYENTNNISEKKYIEMLMTAVKDK